MESYVRWDGFPNVSITCSKEKSLAWALFNGLKLAAAGKVEPTTVIVNCESYPAKRIYDILVKKFGDTGLAYVLPEYRKVLGM